MYRIGSPCHWLLFPASVFPVVSPGASHDTSYGLSHVTGLVLPQNVENVLYETDKLHVQTLANSSLVRALQGNTKYLKTLP